MSTAADAVWVMSNKQTLNIRGSYYNMTDEFYNPSLLIGEEGLQNYWPNNPWYSSLYNSGYVYTRRSTSPAAPARARPTASAARAASGGSARTPGRCRRR